MDQDSQVIMRIICDSCKRREASMTCKCCGGNLCRFCEALVFGCQISPQVCKTCYSSVEVAKIITNAGDKIKKIRDARDRALAWHGETAMGRKKKE